MSRVDEGAIDCRFPQPASMICRPCRQLAFWKRSAAWGLNRADR
jgi:hypothetical protein